MTDDETHVDNLNPLFVLTHVNKAEVTGLLVGSCRVAARALPRASRASLGRQVLTAHLLCQS